MDPAGPSRNQERPNSVDRKKLPFRLVSKTLSQSASVRSTAGLGNIDARVVDERVDAPARLLKGQTFRFRQSYSLIGCTSGPSACWGDAGPTVSASRVPDHGWTRWPGWNRLVATRYGIPRNAPAMPSGVAMLRPQRVPSGVWASEVLASATVAGGLMEDWSVPRRQRTLQDEG